MLFCFVVHFPNILFKKCLKSWKDYGICYKLYDTEIHPPNYYYCIVLVLFQYTQIDLLPAIVSSNFYQFKIQFPIPYKNHISFNFLLLRVRSLSLTLSHSNVCWLQLLVTDIIVYSSLQQQPSISNFHLKIIRNT